MSTRPLILRVPGPEFVSATLRGALVVQIIRAAKLNLVAESISKGAPPATPVPLRVTWCGLPDALSTIAIAALRSPVAVGLKVTLMLQLPPAARVPPHVFVWTKSFAFAPTTATLVIASVASPVLRSVAVCAALVVSSSRLPKPRLDGSRPNARPHVGRLGSGRRRVDDDVEGAIAPGR